MNQNKDEKSVIRELVGRIDDIHNYAGRLLNDYAGNKEILSALDIEDFIKCTGYSDLPQVLQSYGTLSEQGQLEFSCKYHDTYRELEMLNECFYSNDLSRKKLIIDSMLDEAVREQSSTVKLAKDSHSIGLEGIGGGFTIVINFDFNSRCRIKDAYNECIKDGNLAVINEHKVKDAIKKYDLLDESGRMAFRLRYPDTEHKLSVLSEIKKNPSRIGEIRAQEAKLSQKEKKEPEEQSKGRKR